MGFNLAPASHAPALEREDSSIGEQPDMKKDIAKDTTNIQYSIVNIQLKRHPVSSIQYQASSFENIAINSPRKAKNPEEMKSISSPI